MIISAQVFLAGLTGPWALIEFGYLLWFGIINWTVLINDVRKKYVRTFFVVSLMKLMCYVWWLSYRLVCNHFGWNETSVLGVERKPRYHGYICLYMLQYDEIDLYVWWLSYRLVCNSFWLKWNQCTEDWKEIKVPWLHMHL